MLKPKRLTVLRVESHRIIAVMRWTSAQGYTINRSTYLVIYIFIHWKPSQSFKVTPTQDYSTVHAEDLESGKFDQER